MKRTIGNFLIVFSIICAALTFFWIITIFRDLPENLTERIRQQLFFGLFIAAVFLSLECAIFLYGRYLRHRYSAKIPKQKTTRHKWPLLPFFASLVCSIAVTILVFLPGRKLLEIKALFFTIGQGYVLAQLITTSLSEISGINPGKGLMKESITVAFTLLYYAALFYPVFRIATMERKVEVTRYRLMITLLIIFLCIHILVGFVAAALVKA
jgi:hypothetical protein